jgi:hypothetical protein
MPEIPSLADIIIVIILLIPGFVSFEIIRRLAIVEREFSELEITLWSLFLSLVIYVPFSLIVGVRSLDQIRNSIFAPFSIGVLTTLSVVTGLIPALLIRKIWRKGQRPGDLWAYAMKTFDTSRYVIIHTSTGTEIKGEMVAVGAGPSPRDVLLLNPKQIIRDQALNPIDEMLLGGQIYLMQDDIKRIVFL